MADFKGWKRGNPMSKTWEFFWWLRTWSFFCRISDYYKFFPGFIVFCRIFTGLVQLLQSYYVKSRTLHKTVSKEKRRCSYLVKLQLFQIEALRLFDICSGKCTDIPHCLYSKNRKVPTKEVAFFVGQKTCRKMCIDKVNIVESKRMENLRKHKIADETSRLKGKQSTVSSDKSLKVNFIDRVVLLTMNMIAQTVILTRRLTICHQKSLQALKWEQCLLSLRLSAAWPKGKSIVFATTLIAWSGFNHTLVTLLRPWIRRFAMIISAWWLRTSFKLRGQEFEEIHKNIWITGNS